MSSVIRSPFPGMDPYLEAEKRWRGFHHYLADEIVVHLNRQIVPTYYADVEVSTVLEIATSAERKQIRPDVGIFEAEPDGDFTPSPVATITRPTVKLNALSQATKLRRIRVSLLATEELVTVIELLSPANKRGRGFREYNAKRLRVLQSDLNLVEIDLLRRGKRSTWELEEVDAVADYVAVVNRAGSERISDIWQIELNQPLPTLPIPLLYPDPDASLNLTEVVQTVYKRHRLDALIDYTQPIPRPKLRPEMAQWWQQEQPKVVARD